MNIARVEELLRDVRERLIDGRISADEFDMKHVWVSTHCGSAGCIAGWLLHLDDYSLNIMSNPYLFLRSRLLNPVEWEDVVRGESLYKLVYSWEHMEMDDNGQLIASMSQPPRTPAEAIQAIDAWLAQKLGNPWDYVNADN